jgi:peptidoglycan/xylan/chitin deacetylase (PgdA/CDA1 family)
MPSKKAYLAQAMSRTGVSPLVAALRMSMLTEVTILAYHRVLDNWNEKNFPFDPELISASTNEFRWQMKYVRDRYTPITFEALGAHLEGKNTLPSKPLIVTFDDGFDDNYIHAFPILRELELQATFFISTGYIGQSRTFWFDWLHYLVKRYLPVRTIRFCELELPQTRATKQIEDQIGNVLAYAKRLPDIQLRSALVALEKMIGIEYPQSGFPESLPLNWEQVREMSANGQEFGSHSASHPVLTNLTPEMLQVELINSKARLEEEIQRPVIVMSYPDGNSLAFNDNVIDAVRNAGYRFGASYVGGTNNLNQLHHFRLKRLHVERDTTREDFEGMLACPELFA